MNLYECLREVALYAKPVATVRGIVSENRKQAVDQFENLMYAIALARRAGASEYDITEAVGGRVADYLKEED